MSKFVIIKEENAAKIMSAFEKAQGKATARTIDSFKELENITKDIDKRIGTMSKAAKQGTRASYNFQQHFPNAYKYRPESTHFTLLFDKGTWRIDIDSIYRDYCPNNSRYYEYDLILSNAAKVEILKRYE